MKCNIPRTQRPGELPPGPSLEIPAAAQALRRSAPANPWDPARPSNSTLSPSARLRKALRLNCREVDEHVWTRLLRDKAKALRVVKPLHLTLCHTVQTSALRGTAPGENDPSHHGLDGLKQKPRDKWSSRKRRQPVTVPRLLETGGKKYESAQNLSITTPTPHANRRTTL